MANKNANGRTGASGRNSGGGGINTKQHVKTPVRTGQPAKGVNPGAVSYVGNKLGNHAMDRGTFPLRATPWNGKPPVSNNVPLGNQTALKGAGAGAKPGGAGRILHGQAGSQGTHGKPVGPAPVVGRPWFQDFPVGGKK